MKRVKRISTKKDRYRREYERLKRQLRGLGYICLGSIVLRWMSCGKRECACHSDPAMRHGPYYQWTRKVQGKTQSRMIPESLIQSYRAAVRNHRRIDQLLTRMREVSLRALEAGKNH